RDETTAPDGAVSGMPAIRETGPGKNLQAITVSTKRPPYTPHSISFSQISSNNKQQTLFFDLTR
ncbi:hypothetical protein ACB310_20000, partial [Escherichia coli]